MSRRFLIVLLEGQLCTVLPTQLSVNALKAMVYFLIFGLLPEFNKHASLE